MAQKDDGLCSKSDVNIEFDAGAFLRKTCSKIQENLEKFIEDGWTKKTESNPRLYDASKFRLASFKSDSNSVNIQIGITSYKVGFSKLVTLIILRIIFKKKIIIFCYPTRYYRNLWEHIIFLMLKSY